MGRTRTAKRAERLQTVEGPAVPDDVWITEPQDDKVQIKPEAARSKKYHADGVEVYTSAPQVPKKVSQRSIKKQQGKKAKERLEKALNRTEIQQHKLHAFAEKKAEKTRLKHLWES